MDNVRTQRNFVDTNWPPTQAWIKKNGIITWHLRDSHVTPTQRRKAYHKKAYQSSHLNSNQTLTSIVQVNS
jgi:hypothetical protein